MKINHKQNVIPLTALEAVRRPIAEATGMPNAAYSDPDLFAFERDNVLGETWAGLTFTHELPRRGYAKPVDFMGLPLVVMRNRDGDYNVFHNVCSHRGMPLVEEEVAIEGAVRCRYHSWTYDLNGNLRGTPHIGGVGVHSVEGFACEQHGLVAVRSAVWMGIIFINLSGDAGPFEEHIAPLVERWSAFTGQDGLQILQVAHSGSELAIEVKANWKLAVENYCEAYHLPWVHPALNSYSPLDQHYNLIVNETMSGQGTYTYNLSDVAGTSLPQFEAWPREKIRQAEYISLYPNVLLGLQADHVFAMVLQPLTNDRTMEKLQVSYVGDKAAGDEFSACRTSVLESWRLVFGEDVFAVEGLQAGRNSPAFRGGVFSPVLDGPSHHFHGWVAARYGQGL